MREFCEIAQQNLLVWVEKRGINHREISTMSLLRFKKSRLVVQSGNAWRDGTSGEFLTAIRDARLPQEAFERWLLQDYLFVQGLTNFLAIAISKTPRSAQKTLIDGIVALNAELDWFEHHLSQRTIDLQITPHKTCQRYVDYLMHASYTERYEVLLAVMFGVEVSYLYAWSSLEPIGPYAEFITRWTTPQFSDYVGELLSLCDANPHLHQQRAFNEVMRHEKEFWQMSWGN